MIKGLQVSAEMAGVGPAEVNTAGYYFQDLTTGEWRYCYTDVYGQVHVMGYDPATGLVYPLALDFWAKYEQTAPLSKVIEVWPNDRIRISYTFDHKGPAESLTIEAGNCGDLVGSRHYDKGSSNTATKSVGEDSTFHTYTGSVDVVLVSSMFTPYVEVFTYTHIYFLITGKDEEFVMRDALKAHVAAEFQNLSVTNWSKI